MKYMKTLVLILVVFLITFLIGCKSQYKYIEGNIYSETVLKGYNDSKKELIDFITRDKAIEYAQSVFKDGFNINIDRDKLRESIYLTKAGGDFYWNIIWDEIEKKTEISQYYILMSSNTGQIRSCGVISFNKYYNYYEEVEEIDEYNLNLSLEIAKPMIEKMNINIEDFNIEGLNRGIKKILILKDESKSYEFTVDIKLEKLISFNSYGGEWK